MRPAGHIILGGAASVALYPFPGLQGVVFFLSTVFVDSDHYLDYVYHNGLRDLSLSNSMRYHRLLRAWWGRPEFLNLSVFHTVEFVGALGVIYAWSNLPWLGALFWGLVFHMAVDTLYLAAHKGLTLRAYSVVEYYVRKRRLLGRGLSPEKMYAEAVRSVMPPGQNLKAEKTHGE
jgi:hypothetical protein